jgi:hypothetical protein
MPSTFAQPRILGSLWWQGKRTQTRCRRGYLIRLRQGTITAKNRACGSELRSKKAAPLLSVSCTLLADTCFRAKAIAWNTLHSRGPSMRNCHECNFVVS